MRLGFRFHLYLENGAFRPVPISLISLGLTRVTALLLAKQIILPGAATPEECLRGCREAISNAPGLRLPATVRREIATLAGGYYEGNKRIRRRFSDYATAKREGSSVAAKLINTDGRALQLTGEDARIFSRAKEAVSALQVPLDLVAVEYAEACKVLGGKRILEAAKFFIKHSASALKEGTIPELVAD